MTLIQVFDPRIEPPTPWWELTMAFTLKPIKPKGRAPDAARIMAGVKQAMEKARDGALADFKKTTATWDHTVDFEAVPVPTGYVIGTEDEVYGYVDAGTKPHIIAPHGKALVFQGGYTAKTAVRVIGSTSGGASGAVIIRRKAVRHPGTKARAFSETIAKTWQTELPQIINEAIGSAVAGSD